MFGAGPGQILLLVIVVILLFGSSRLPGLAKSLGQSITEFKKGVKGIEDKSGDSSQENE